MKHQLTSTINPVNELLTLEDVQDEKEPTTEDLAECERLVQSLDLVELLQNEEI